MFDEPTGAGCCVCRCELASDVAERADCGADCGELLPSAEPASERGVCVGVMLFSSFFIQSQTRQSSPAGGGRLPVRSSAHLREESTCSSDATSCCAGRYGARCMARELPHGTGNLSATRLAHLAASLRPPTRPAAFMPPAHSHSLGPSSPSATAEATA